MNIIAKIGIGIAVIIAIPLVIALFTKNEYSVAREITINKPKVDVFDYVKHVKNQDYYNKWVMEDPRMKKDFKGTDGTVGFVYAWDGKEAGKGEQEIKNLTEGEAMDLEVRFIRPFEGISKTRMTTEAVSGNQTRVKWGMAGRNPYPMNFMNLFMDRLLGKDIDKSLNTLKSLLEQPGGQAVTRSIPGKTL